MPKIITGKVWRSVTNPSPEFNPAWDVYRDTDGQPVTISLEQCHAIWHAIRVVEQVRASEGHRSLWEPGYGADLMKSRLLGRMLFEGKPPTRTRPPLALGGPDWTALDGGDPFAVS
jgi:hypothetical protein